MERVEAEEKKYFRPSRDKRNTYRQKVNQLEISQQDSDSDSDVVGLMVRHALSVGELKESDSSGATCHICNDVHQFAYLENLSKPMDVALGDGHLLKASQSGVVDLRIQITWI